MFVRIQKAKIKNFRNVVNGEIRFPCNLSTDIFSPNADIIGIYGQNGSGKTTFIHVLNLLKTLISGDSISDNLSDCISVGKDVAEISFEFSILDTVGKQKIKAFYSADLSRENIVETLKTSYLKGGKWTYRNMVLSCDLGDSQTIFLPLLRKKEYFGTDQELSDELRVSKLLCSKEHRSFIFSPEFLRLLEYTDVLSPDITVIKALHNYGIHDFFVILNRYSGLISLDTALPFSFRMDRALGQVALPIDAPAVLPNDYFQVITQVIDSINIVLCEIIPHMRLSLRILGKELMENSKTGIQVQIIRELRSDSGEVSYLPLKYESEGVKKIISILHLLIAAYNNPSITLAIDELDSGIYEYLLGELLRIMQTSGQGQLVFTSHNLYPLETLNNNSIVFTTVNPEARYTRLTNIKTSNNLRLRYLREVALGSDTGDALYSETNSAEIAHAMRKAGMAASTPTTNSSEGCSDG